MFNTALELMQSRQDIIDHDRELILSLQSESHSIRDTWHTLLHIQSDMVRFFACEEYLIDLCGNGIVENSGADYISFSYQGMVTLLPCLETKEPRILVKMNNYPQLVQSLKQPSLINPTPVETLTREYVKAVREGASLDKLLEIRAQMISKDISSWGRAHKFLYYHLRIRLRDALRKQADISYWENLASDLEKRRIIAYNAQVSDRLSAKNTIRDFRFGLYTKLSEFGFPVYIGNGSEWLLAEEIFSAIVSSTSP